jgi:hypothetical protein
MSRPALVSCARVIRWASAIAFGASAVRHLWLSIGEASFGRHAVFVGINAVGAALLVWRPRWLVLPIGALAAQQIVSHGGDLIRSMTGPGPLDVMSLGVMVFFPILLVAIGVEKRRA